jgi:UDP:flavonoid glycosyltransferase YjiC (YdhE family)
VARILFAWELGANLGHLGQLALLAEKLRAQGHEPMFALRDVTSAERIAGGFPFVQAPVWPSRRPSASTSPCSYPEIMQHYGFADCEGLLAMVRAWRRLFEWTAPETIVFDHAPTALLAARGLPITRVLYGVGFSSPPRVCPMPNFRVWEDVPLARLESSESRVLETVNGVLTRLGEQSLRALHELFDADHDFLCTFPELDHYPGRRGGEYCGPVFQTEAPTMPVWPAQGTKRICVYMRQGMPGFGVLCEALSALPYAVLWIAPGADTAVMQRHQSPRLAFTDKPVDLSRAAAQADAAVLYGSHGTTAAMLLAGLPLALFPNHVEQMLVSGNVARLGACSVLSPSATVDDVRASVVAIVEEPRYRQRAVAFAAKYSSFDPQRVADCVARKISARCAALA